MKIFNRNIKGGVSLLEPLIWLGVVILTIVGIIIFARSYIEKREVNAIVNEINSKHEILKEAKSDIISQVVNNSEKCIYIVYSQKDKKWSKITVNNKELENFKMVEIVTKCDDNSKDDITIEFKN